MPDDDPLYVAYHDLEWGVPVHEEARLFEMLTLEGAQAGLSWITVLRKREGYRRVFSGFDPEAVAGYDRGRIEEILMDPAIVRNRLKVESTVANARAILGVRGEFGGLSEYLWGLVGGAPVRNEYADYRDIPARTEVSLHMSRELRLRGFGFVGPTVCYAFMQAVGMVDDHETSCFRRGLPGG